MAEAAETKRIYKFFDWLTEVPDREAEFENAPDPLMQEFGLNQRQHHLVLDATLAELRAEIQNELDADGDTRELLVIRARMA